MTEASWLETSIMAKHGLANGNLGKRHGLDFAAQGGFWNKPLPGRVRTMPVDYGFDEIDAYMFSSQAGRMRLGNMVDLKYTVSASVLKKYLIA